MSLTWHGHDAEKKAKIHKLFISDACTFSPLFLAKTVSGPISLDFPNLHHFVRDLAALHFHSHSHSHSLSLSLSPSPIVVWAAMKRTNHNVGSHGANQTKCFI